MSNPIQEMFQIKAIGEVHGEPGNQHIAIRPEFRGALEGLSGFSHGLVIWWAHRLNPADAPDAQWRTSLPYAPDRKAGVFATRSPFRPNPVAVDVCTLLEVDAAKGIIRIPFIDALPGTPVLDVKGYYPVNDRVRKPRTPDWSRHWPEWIPETRAEGEAWMKIVETWR